MNIFDYMLSASPEEVGQREVEDVFYIYIENPIACMTELGIADTVEHHDQYEIQGDASRVRVRKITRGDDVVYEMTRKLSKDTFINGENEFTESISEFVYECYRDMAPNGMIKSRYVLPVTGHATAKFEFDLFRMPDGSIANWCKVDLEIPLGGFKGVVPVIPKVYSEIILASDASRAGDIAELYDTVFITRGNTRIVTL